MESTALRIAVRAGFSVEDQMTAVLGIRGGTVRTTPGWEWDMILHGLAGAIERYRAALAVERGLVLRVCTGEALWWICSGDEFLRDRAGGGVTAKLWYPELEKTPAGAVLAGLVYARHRAGHEQAHLLAATIEASADYQVRQPDGSLTDHVATGVGTFGMRPEDPVPDGGFKFESLDLISRGGDRTEERNLKRDRCYDEHVAGRPVLEVLEQVLDAFKATLQVERPAGEAMRVALKGSHYLGGTPHEPA